MSPGEHEQHFSNTFQRADVATGHLALIALFDSSTDIFTAWTLKDTPKFDGIDGCWALSTLTVVQGYHHGKEWK